MTAAFIPLADSVPSPAPDIRPERPQDGPAIEALLDHAFGPGRFAKASERVREFAPLRLDLSFCAWEGERLVGVVRQSEIAVGGRRLVFLGPLAVNAAARRLLGRRDHPIQAGLGFNLCHRGKVGVRDGRLKAP